MHHLVFMNSPQTVQSETHQLWLPIPQETARPHKLPLSLNMEGEDMESPALADNHQVALPERAHSPATDHLMCSSNQTATVRSTTVQIWLTSCHSYRQFTAAVPVEMQSPAFSKHQKDCSNCPDTLIGTSVCREILCSVHWRHGWGRHIIPCILNLGTRETGGQLCALATYLLQQEPWYALDLGLVGPQSWYGCCTEENICAQRH